MTHLQLVRDRNPDPHSRRVASDPKLEVLEEMAQRTGLLAAAERDLLAAIAERDPALAASCCRRIYSIGALLMSCANQADAPR